MGLWLRGLGAASSTKSELYQGTSRFCLPQSQAKSGRKNKRLACSETEPNACCFALPELHHVEVLRSWGQKQLKDHQEVTFTLNPPAAGLQLLHP